MGHHRQGFQASDVRWGDIGMSLSFLAHRAGKAGVYPGVFPHVSPRRHIISTVFLDLPLPSGFAVKMKMILGSIFVNSGSLP